MAIKLHAAYNQSFLAQRVCICVCTDPSSVFFTLLEAPAVVSPLICYPLTVSDYEVVKENVIGHRPQLQTNGRLGHTAHNGIKQLIK